MRIFIILILAAVFSSASVAQTIRVYSEIEFAPLADVVISDIGYTKSVITDLSGEANIASFGRKDSLIFEHPDFHSAVIALKTIKQDNYNVLLLDINTLNFRVNVGADKREEIEDGNSDLQTKILRSDDIRKINPQTTADMLQETGSVLVQKSQAGGGSPVIRGFEANRILLVIDGVRMNNAIYRSGHLQNAITVDNNILSSTDIHFGPGSVIYGSDALGGVLHFHTKTPKLIGEDKFEGFELDAMARYNTVNQEKTAHIDFEVGGKKWAYMASGTVSDFGDLRMGANRTHGYEDFGKVPFEVAVINNQDSARINTDENVHKGSGYKQYDLLQKVRFKPNQNLDFIWNTQFSTSSDVPRFDRMNDLTDEGLPKFAEWYYGPQQRFLTSLKMTSTREAKLFSKANLVVAYQDIKEDRINRRFGRTEKNYRFENVNVFSANVDLSKQIDSTQSLFYGIEATHNDVTSTAFTRDINSNEESPNSTRYPDAGSTMSTASFYLAYDKKLSEKVLLNTGARYNYTLLKANFEDTNFVKLPFNTISFNGGALSGSAGLEYRPSSSTRVGGMLSTGFRSPNIDDVGKVFEKDGNVVVPNDQLKPEHAYNAEINLSKTFRKRIKSITSQEKKSDFITVGGSLFYTKLQNAIVRSSYQLNGEDSLLYDGDLAKIQTNRNAQNAYIWGAMAEVKIRFSPVVSLKTNINYTYGRDVSNSQPLGHIPPVFGMTSFIIDKGKWNLNLYTRYNGWKQVKDYAPSGEDNLQEATVDGTPSWAILNLKGSINLHETIQLQVGIENIFDTHYKPFASGMSGPGRALSVTLRTHIK